MDADATMVSWESMAGASRQVVECCLVTGSSSGTSKAGKLQQLQAMPPQ